MKLFLSDIVRARSYARRRLAGSRKRLGSDHEKFIWVLAWADLAPRATGESRRIVIEQMRAVLRSVVAAETRQVDGKTK